MSRKNQNAAVIEHAEPTSTTIAVGVAPHIRHLSLGSTPNPISPVALQEQVAKSKMIIRNINLPEGREAFPHEPQFQTIDMFFPLAEGGELYVDQIDTKEREEDPKKREAYAYAESVVARKAAIMKRHNKRYVVLRQDTELSDVMEQLERLAAKPAKKTRKSARPMPTPSRSSRVRPRS